MRRLALLAAVVACAATPLFVIDVTKAPPSPTSVPTVIDVL